MEIEALGVLPHDIIKHEVSKYVPTKVQLENGYRPIEVHYHPVKYRRNYTTYQTDYIHRYYAKDFLTKLYRPSVFTGIDVQMHEPTIHVPMTFIEVKRSIERHIYENPDDNYTRELRFYRVVFCLFSKTAAMRWVRHMNRQVKWRGFTGNFRYKQFKETTVRRDWYGTYKVWRYSRRQSWRFIPKAKWNDILNLPPAILFVPMAANVLDAL